MLHVFDECANEQYQRNPTLKDDQSASGSKQKIIFDQLNFSTKGQIIESDGDIIAENVPIITPTGDIIVESLSLTVKFFKQKLKSSIFLLHRLLHPCMFSSPVRMVVVNLPSFE